MAGYLAWSFKHSGSKSSFSAAVLSALHGHCKETLLIYPRTEQTLETSTHAIIFRKKNKCSKLHYKTCIFLFPIKPVAVPCITNKENNIGIASMFSHARFQIKQKKEENVGALERHQSYVPKVGYSLSQHCPWVISSHILQFGFGSFNEAPASTFLQL